MTPLAPGEKLEAPTAVDEAWGYAYVLEGARLGGLSLAEGFRRTFPDRPTSYLWSPADRGRWNDFRKRLDAATLSEMVVVDAARAAFQQLENCVDHVQGGRARRE